MALLALWCYSGAAALVVVRTENGHDWEGPRDVSPLSTHEDSVPTCVPDAPPVADAVSPERQTYTVPEVARMLGICRVTAYARAKDGTIPTIRLGHRVLVPKSAVLRLLGTDPQAGG
jgi:excisionase family DNA binding protein